MKSNVLENKLMIPPTEQEMKCEDCKGITNSANIGKFLQT